MVSKNKYKSQPLLEVPEGWLFYVQARICAGLYMEVCCFTAYGLCKKAVPLLDCVGLLK